MRRVLIGVLLAAWLPGCGDSSAPAGNSAGSTPASAPGASAAAAAPAASAARPAPAKAAGADFSGRTGELINPDDHTMVFLYYDLAGIDPPLDRWVEEDRRVRSAVGVDKAAQRDRVRAELEAGVASVRNVGAIRLSLNSARLSRYDPSYGEFMVSALAPSSVIQYEVLGQKVELRFANGRTAQIWKVPAEEARLIEDTVGNRNVELDVELIVRSVQPGPGGGSISADVREFELRESSGGTTIGRVRIAD